MKTFQDMKWIRLVLTLSLVFCAGCVSSKRSGSGAPFAITMTSPNGFMVNDKPVDASGLVKVLERNHVPKGDPLIIEMSTDMPFAAIGTVTKQLTMAGYKPFFKSPRHAGSSVVKPPLRRSPPGIQRP
jgi:hypothetical protein